MCIPLHSESQPIRQKKFSPVKSSPGYAKSNTERRKEKSRNAARFRRGKESDVFTELGALLPLEDTSAATLDKASVIRIAIAFLQTRSLVHWGLGSRALQPLANSSSSASVVSGLLDVLEALDGFLMVLTENADVVYVSDNIVTFLGLSQIEVMGHSLLDYTHPCDHELIKSMVSSIISSPSAVVPTAVKENNKGVSCPPPPSAQPASAMSPAFVRFKCTLTPKGRSVNLKSATHKVVQVRGQVLTSSSSPSHLPSGMSAPCDSVDKWLVALCVPVPHPANIDFPLHRLSTFVTKHSLDLVFTYVDDNVRDFCGFRPEDLVGRSLYHVHHALDTNVIADAHRTLRSKGQVETGRYRLLCFGGGFVWVVTQATHVAGQRDARPQAVVCVNYVVSGVECGDVIFSECQLGASPTPAEVTWSPPVPSPQETKEVLGAPLPVDATCSLLRDRTDDMTDAFLTFDNGSRLSVFKEDPEDLTHLAPSVVDNCQLVYEDLSEFEVISSAPPPESTFCDPNLIGLKKEQEVPIKNVFPTTVNNNAYLWPKGPDSGYQSPASPSCLEPIIIGATSPRLPLLSQTSNLNPYGCVVKKSSPHCPPPSALARNNNANNISMDAILDSSALEFKLEDDFDLRNNVGDMLLFEQEDFLQNGTNQDGRFDDSSFIGLGKLVGGPPSPSPFASLQGSKAIADMGGNLVDPNQVLPGQFFIKDENDDGSEELRCLLMETSSAKETTQPVVLQIPSRLQGQARPVQEVIRLSAKRAPSSPAILSHNKKMRIASPATTQFKQEPFEARPHYIISGKRESPSISSFVPQSSGRLAEALAPPYSPIMQQMLVSDDNDSCGDNHSVLRNLLVSGRDERAGYAVSGADGRSTPLAGQTASASSASVSSQAAKDPLESLANFPLNKEGKVELTRQQLSALLRRAGGRQSPPPPPLPSPPNTPSPCSSSGSSPHAETLFMPHTSPSISSIYATKLNRGAQTPSASLLQPPFFVTAIPSLLDLTADDYEVNAPAPDNPLLQGADLLLALEPTQ